MDAATIVRRILRVDHAGEHGAVAIYSAQIAKLGTQHDLLKLWLAETLSHEERHRSLFRSAMPNRSAKPCRALSVWKIGGSILGALTAWLGPTAVLICTAAVERTVHGHLEEQISFLDRADPALATLVRDILKDEDQHLAYAEQHHDRNTLVARMLTAVITVATEALIAISTRGDSLNLNAALRAS